jgi:uracil-DNA glycosylase family 4
LEYGSLGDLEADLIGCRRCPRLVDWREEVARTRRAAFRSEEYWGRPVPGFGDPYARLLVVGLAPAAHGANRTGRMFTGDRSGDWLYRSMHREGFASIPTSVSRHDGLRLSDAWVTAVVRCAPPANKPTAREQDSCRTWLAAEIALLSRVKVVVALGGLAHRGVLRMYEPPRPWPRFGHGAESRLGDGPYLISSYHPSQQNTFTGRLTERMLDDVFGRAAGLIRQLD